MGPSVVPTREELASSPQSHCGNVMPHVITALPSTTTIGSKYKPTSKRQVKSHSCISSCRDLHEQHEKKEIADDEAKSSRWK